MTAPQSPEPVIDAGVITNTATINSNILRGNSVLTQILTELQTISTQLAALTQIQANTLRTANGVNRSGQ